LIKETKGEEAIYKTIPMKPRVLEQKSQNLNKCNNNNTLQSYQEEKKDEINAISKSID
jgi:hypothetical protein